MGQESLEDTGNALCILSAVMQPWGWGRGVYSGKLLFLEVPVSDIQHRRT